MNLLMESLGRALLWCLNPRIVLLSLLPLLLMAAVAMLLAVFFWDAALQGMDRLLMTYSVFNEGVNWLRGVGAGWLPGMLTPVLLALLALPCVMTVSLLVVSSFITPAIVKLVAQSRYPHLKYKHGATVMASVLYALGYTILALLAMLASIPFWLIPPLVLVLPPLIWGWLTYRIMAFDALAEHASRDERQRLFRRHRLSLLLIGVLTGYLGAAPSIVWISGAVFAFFFVVLIPIAIWIYTLVLVLSSLWFTHYCLAALAQLRSEPQIAEPAA